MKTTKGLLTVTEDQNQSLAKFSEKQKKIAKELYNINCIVNYPISDEMLLTWATIIDRLNPEITPEKTKEIVDGFMKGEISFDSKVGIRNIFLALRTKFVH